MTKAEFLKWRNLHIALFPSLMGYIARAFGDNRELPELMWAEWYKVLAKMPLEYAIEASRKLAASDEEAKPERHPHLVAQIARQLMAEQYVWDALKPEEECPLCRGTGAVLIRKDGRRAATRCSCPLGKRRYPFLRIFNPEIDEAEP